VAEIRHRFWLISASRLPSAVNLIQ